MQASYSPLLIILSVFIGIISSYTALTLVERISINNRRKKIMNLLFASLIMGKGVFSMHFVGMLALHSHVLITYDPTMIMVALMVSVVSSFATFYLLSLQSLNIINAGVSGFITGIGIVLLHYIAMLAIEEPIKIDFRSIYFILSILISLVFSTMALRAFYKIKQNSQSPIKNLFSAVILGLTMSLMHYTGMKAILFLPHHHEEELIGINSFDMAVMVSFLTIIIMCVAIFWSILDFRKFQSEKQLYLQIRESEEHYRRLVEQFPDPIVVQSENKIIFINEAILPLLNTSSKKEIIGKSILDFINPDNQGTLKKRIEHIHKGLKVNPLEQQIIRFDGSVRDVEVTGAKFMYGDVNAVQLIIRDITNQKRIRKEFEGNQQRYQSLFEYNPDLVYSLDHHGRLTEINKTTEDIFGFTKQELTNLTFHGLIDPQYLQKTIQKFIQALAGKPQNYETVCIDKNGNKIPLNITNIPIFIGGEITGIFGIAKDISKEKAALNEIKSMVYTDQLTGLPNRRWFYKELNKVLKNTEKMAILTIDFDDFKEVNDTFGHSTGDFFLQQISNRIKECLGKDDQIARLGGDEFCIIMKNATKGDAEQLAQRIIKKMHQTIPFFQSEISASLSIGISVSNKNHNDAEILLKQADLAMYLAKEKGKNNYRFFTNELNEKVKRKRQLENALYKAVEQAELTLYYQPQVNLQTGQLVGLEALLRWNPSFGYVAPNEFIPIAEDTGLILPIGEWVIRNACQQIKLWKQKGYPEVIVSVNVSAKQFRDKHLGLKIKRIIEEEQINPCSLEIEITESIMLNLEESTHIIQELKKSGVKVAIDDFGAGYSSLNVIKNVNIDTLKIDKSLMDDIVTNRRNRSILKALIDAGNSLETKIVIEGIETKEQIDILKNLTVIGQGYFFSRPLPPDQLEQVLNKFKGGR
jgi:diguanylate cyclase